MSSSRSKPQYNAEASGTSAYSLSASLRSVPDTRSPPRRMVKLNERLHGSAELPTAPLAPSSRLAAISPPRSSRATAFYSTMHENADPGASMAPVGSRAVRRPAPISSTSSLASTSFESSSVSLSASSSSSLASAMAQQPAATASSLSRSERPRGHSRSGSMSDVDMKIRTPRTPHSASLAVAGSSRRAKSPGSPRSARPASSSTTSLSLSERHSHRSSRHSSRPTSRSHSPERAHGNENKSDHGLSPSEYSPDSGNSPKSLQARPPGIKVFQRIANEHAYVLLKLAVLFA